MKQIAKIRHDKQFQWLAKKIMKLSFHNKQEDKSYVLEALFYLNDFFSKVKHARR